MATTLISILRGTTQDEFLDDEPNDTVVYKDIPASIIERTRNVFDQGSDTPRILRYTTGRVDSRTDIQTGDLVKDQRTGLIYFVDDFSAPASPVHTADMQLNLRRST